MVVRVQSRRGMTSNDNPRMDRVRRLLDLVIREAGMTYTDVEGRLRWGGGAVSRIVSGSRELRVEQLLAMLDLTGMKTSQFFTIAERFEALEVTLDLRSEILRALAGESQAADAAEAQLSDTALQKRIETALRKMFRKLPEE